MKNLWKYDYLKGTKLFNLLKHPITEEIIVMKSSAVGKTTFIPELFKKNIYKLKTN